MTTLIENLRESIKRMEAEHGSEDPYVKDLKEQLRACLANGDKSAQEVFMAQTFSFPSEIAEPMTPAQVKQLGMEKGMQSPEFMDAMDAQLDALFKARASERTGSKKTPQK